MDYTVVLSDQAKEDVSEIYDYIRTVLQSEANANSLLNRLYAAMDSLSYMAESYHLYPNEPWHSLGVRYFSVGNYSVFYTIAATIATVLHVSYGRRNLDNVLSN